MGCDIHAHMEVKVNGKWEHWSCPNIDRNYQLFSKMAGVRNYRSIDAISEPKGLPNDISMLTLLDVKSWGSDGHSHSYLTAYELDILDDWLKDEYDFPNSNLEYGILHSYFPESDFSPWAEEYRLVFWFDN